MKLYQHAAVGLFGILFSQSNVAAQVVSLGSASSYAVLGASTVTNTGLTTLDGDLGVFSGTAITGFFGTNENDGPGTFTGASYQGNAFAQLAQADALTAYNNLEALTTTQDLTGQNLGTLTLTPGVYHFDTSAQLTGDLTLDGAGDYVFQIGSTLTTASNSSIIFIDGANSLFVFWQVGTSGTLGTGSTFGGTIIAHDSITANTGANLDGRLVALNGAVTLDSNRVAVPEPSSSLSLLIAAGLLLRRTRA